MPEESPVREPSRLRRIVVVLIAVDLVVVFAVLGIWLAMGGQDADDRNVLNEGLRGSRPPAGETFPKLDAIAGIQPPMPPAAKLRGDAIQLVATCLDCRSGEIIGGYLGRLTRADIPDGARVLLVGWDGDLDAWKRSWNVDEDLVELHAAADARTATALRTRFGIDRRGDAEESGITYLFDPRGRWRASYFIGQLDRGDITADLRTLATER